MKEISMLRIIILVYLEMNFVTGRDDIYHIDDFFVSEKEPPTSCLSFQASSVDELKEKLINDPAIQELVRKHIDGEIELQSQISITSTNQETIVNDPVVQEPARQRIDSRIGIQSKITISSTNQEQEGNKRTLIPNKKSTNSQKLSTCNDVCVEVANKNIADKPDHFSTTGGLSTIHPSFNKTFGMKVYCDCSDGYERAWMVIQRRTDGSCKFDRKWKEYSCGFCDVNGDFWMGLKYIHKFTVNKKFRLKVELENEGGDQLIAVYSDFSISSEADGFRLRAQGFSGNVVNALFYHNGKKFSAVDNDNTDSSCTKDYGHAGWWFDKCAQANLNANLVGENFHERMFWGHQVMVKATMKIQPSD